MFKYKKVIILTICILFYSCKRVCNRTNKNSVVRKSYPIENIVYMWQVNNKNVIIKYKNQIIYSSHVNTNFIPNHGVHAVCTYKKDGKQILSNFVREWEISNEKIIEIEILIDNHSLKETIKLDEVYTILVIYIELENRTEIITKKVEGIMNFY